MMLVRVDRLRQLAKGLRNPKLVPPEHFDMAVLADGDLEHRECGSAGCALGHCPTIFGKPWRWRKTTRGFWLLEFGDAKGGNVTHAARGFFGLTPPQAGSLFFPSNTVERREYHRPDRTAARIEAFCRRIEGVK